MVVRACAITGTGRYYVLHLSEAYVEYLGPEGHGVWFGEALAHFGLKAGEKFAPRALVQLLAGNYPDGRPAVQKQRWKKRSRQPGTDSVYSVPKPVSVLYAAASRKRKRELSRDLLECVIQSLKDIEWKVAWGRRGHGGKKRERGKYLWAVIPHEDNRESEPALHWHCVNPNVAVHLDGTTGAGISKPLYLTQRLSSVLFDLATSHLLQTKYGLTIVPDGNGSYRVAGVPDSLIKTWSVRTRQIWDRLREAGDLTPTAAEKLLAARGTRGKKKRTPQDVLHSGWEATAGEHSFDPEQLIDTTRGPRRGLSEKAQALAADMAVFHAAESLTFRHERFSEEFLTVTAGVRCYGRGISVPALLAAVERAVTRPLEHGLAPAGEKDGSPLFKRWDPPSPAPAPRIPDQAAALAAPPGTQGEKPKSEERTRAPRPTPTVAGKPASAEPAQSVSVADSVNSPKRGRRVFDLLAVWLAPVRAWIAVRDGIDHLVLTRGHFTRSELINHLVRSSVPTGVPRAAITREVDRTIGNLNRHKLVPVGRRDGGVVFTTEGQRKLELATIRLASALASRRGRKVKDRYRKLLAGLLHDAGAGEVARFLTDRPRLRLLDAKPGDEQMAILNHVARAFERSGGRVHWLAPTALGADDLRHRTGHDAMTVKGFLRRLSPMPLREVLRHLLERPYRPIGWIAGDVERLRRPLLRLSRRDTVIVDHTHFLGTRELHDLLKKVSRSRAKLILAGDTEGLSPPVAGGGWHYLTTRLPVTRIERREPHGRRPELDAAEELRRGRPKAAVEVLCREGRVTFAAEPGEAVDRLLDAYKLAGGLKDPAQHLVVGGSRLDAAILNRRIQSERRRAGLLGLAAVKVASGASVRFGDRVTFTRPIRKFSIQSGERGQVTFVNPLRKSVTVRTDRGQNITVPLRQFPYLDLAYAATAARSSGLSATHRYALIRGPAFVRGAVLSIFERTKDRVAIFTSLPDKDALAAVIARRGEKRLAIAHGRPEGEHPRPALRANRRPSLAALGGELPAMDPM